MEDVITRYMDDVRSRAHPGPEDTVYMKEEELRGFAEMMKWATKPKTLDPAG